MERAIRYSVERPELRRIIPKLCEKISTSSNRRCNSMLILLRERKRCVNPDVVEAAAKRAVKHPQPDSRGLAIVLTSAASLKVVPHPLPQRDWPADALWGCIVAGDRRDSLFLVGVPIMSVSHLKSVLNAMSDDGHTLSPLARRTCIARLHTFLSWKHMKNTKRYLASTTCADMIGHLLRTGTPVGELRPLALPLITKEPVYMVENIMRALKKREVWTEELARVWIDEWLESSYVHKMGDALVLCNAIESMQVGLSDRRIFMPVWDALITLAEREIENKMNLLQKCAISDNKSNHDDNAFFWPHLSQLLHYFCRQNKWKLPVYARAGTLLSHAIELELEVRLSEGILPPTPALALMLRVLLRNDAMSCLLLKKNTSSWWTPHLANTRWSTMILYSLANARECSYDDDTVGRWDEELKKEVQRRWEGVMHDTCSFLQNSQDLQQPTYEMVLQQMKIGDLGPKYTPRILESFGVICWSGNNENVDKNASWVDDCYEKLSRRKPEGQRHHQRSSGFLSYSLKTDDISYCGELIIRSGDLSRIEDTASIRGAAVGFADNFFDRRKDVEFTALKKVESFSTFETTGMVNLYCDRLPCLSCVGAIAQFRRAFPQIELNMAYGTAF